MADYLLYWKHFWKDSKIDPVFDEQWHIGQKSFFDRVRLGDNFWVVISGDVNHPNKWMLLTRITVLQKKVKSRPGRPYQMSGNRETSLRFDFDSQKDFAPILRKLEFASGKRIFAQGRLIGNFIQNLRILSPNDSNLLIEYTKNIQRHETDAGFSGDITNLSFKKTEKAFAEFARKGAGFGNPETNKKVETAAIAYVSSKYEFEGWKVESVEAKKCGYDLLCTKRSKELHVEVKGVQGSSCAFIITPNEKRQAEITNNFVICIVTSTLSKKPQMHSYTGIEFLKKFNLRSLSFYAELKS